MNIAKTIDKVRKLIKQARSEGKKIGFVPTMGALHAGHFSLIEEASKKCDFIVVSIFVNPTQFGPKEDFNKYPRPVETDVKICKKAGVDMVFIPSAEEMYDRQNLTWVNVEKITDLLCGSVRPGHFRGVATVCTKLFNIITPDMAFFGQKDAQQAIMIKRMVSDLNMPIKIIVCPTMRESDGLALSSRNQYLTDIQREDAVLIYQSLQEAQELFEHGVMDSKTIINKMRIILSRSPLMEIEYIEAVDVENLQRLENIRDKALIAVAVKLGTTRLIDNIVLGEKK